ncbi:hypothetical protein [Parapedobacter sp. DT-150]|uniref:hypothetical protein n=1 Tax=Parapedobacter sp. DT-150 TaxID=3396162 RepID=UPI003F1CEE9A
MPKISNFILALHFLLTNFPFSPAVFPPSPVPHLGLARGVSEKNPRTARIQPKRGPRYGRTLAEERQKKGGRKEELCLILI